MKLRDRKKGKNKSKSMLVASFEHCLVCGRLRAVHCQCGIKQEKKKAKTRYFHWYYSNNSKG